MSWYFGYMEYGAFVMYIHDMSDIPLYVTRLLKNTNAPQWLQLCFVPFPLVSWFVFRLVLLPKYIYVWYFSQTIAPFMKFYCIPCLVVLYCLHLYWFLLMLKKVQRAVSKK
jgi:hypothetical protein